MTTRTQSSPAYAYKSLENKECSILDDDYEPFDSFIIRIIDLEPAEHVEDELRCKIEPADLSQISRDTSYDAISYVWGKPIFSHALFCGKSKISITPTLDRALRRFRNRKEKRRLWADAVCINQEDRKELGQQVQRMSQIYSSATSVLVWLGDGPEMDKCVNFLWGLSSCRHESSVTAESADESIKEELARFFGDTRVDAIQRFLALPWFTRRWVIQEVVMRNAHFYYGSLDITSHALHHAIYILNKSTFSFNREVLDHIRHLERVTENFEHREIEAAGGMLDLLVQFSEPACSDERDRIYAYLGIADDVRSPYANVVRRQDSEMSPYDLDERREPWQKESIPILVDYEADPKHVYSAFAEQMLRHKHHLDILHCSGAFRLGLNSMSSFHQSWVPDWRIPMRYRPFISVPWFSAGGPEEKSEPFLNYPWCSVEGFVFDTVSACYVIPGFDTREKRIMPPIAELCSALRMTGRYHTGERVWQVLGQSFIADHALNYELQCSYGKSASSCWGVTGKRMKRNASERDMHTLLDWWTDSEASGLRTSTFARSSSGIQRSDMKKLVKKHSKSLHRIPTIGVFLKPGHTANEWGPTSYEQQSHWHSRIEDEMEPYFMRHMDDMANKTNGKQKEAPEQGKRKLLTGGDHGKESSIADEGPDDEPYDCEWRHQDGGFICFEPHNRNLERYAENAHNTLRGRAFFITSKGYVGIGPDDIAEDDTVVILYGARTPFILRKMDKLAHWRLAGDCYVHGIMSGEALEMDKGLDRQFILV